MSTIIAGQAAEFTVAIKRDGAPISIQPSSEVTARIYDASGLNPLSDPVTLNASMAGADWPSGVVGVALSASVADLPAGECVLVIASTAPSLVQRFRLKVETAGVFERSALFVKDIAVERMRADSLMLAASGVLPAVSLSDEFLWDKLRSAEAEIAHTLRVPLAPTRFFTSAPSDAQIAALPSGMPWAIDPAHDYSPNDWYGDKWGLIQTRQKPIQSVVSMKFVYPSPAQTIVDVPADWIRFDGKYGQLQLVPTGTQYQTLLGGLFMSQLSGGRTLPFTIALEYIAGLANAQRDYPDLIDAVYKLASTKIIEDAFLPQSGSISADGLSQSLSVDVSKYHEAVDRVLHGSGSNGGLMARIHGIRVMAM
jgi:hypothetical protein